MSDAPRPLRLGTRRSALARTQSGHVASWLRQHGYDVELVDIVTEGDLSRAPLTQMGGTGVFASALRHALHAGTVDLAVHSMKDLPTAVDPGLVIAAVPPREDPRDALCARDRLTLAQLPEGARVGTGSPRRAAQLCVARPDLRVVSLRGNVETRLAAVRDGTLDAVVLAAAGLARLGRLEQATELLDPTVMLPAAAQGALAVECREDRGDVRTALADLEDADARAATTAERSLLARLEAGCTAPIGALAVVTAKGLELEGFLGSEEDGADRHADHLPSRRARAVGPRTEPAALGRRLARQLSPSIAP